MSETHTTQKTDIPALREALAKATPGQIEMHKGPIRDLRVQGVYETSSVLKATWKALFMHEADAIAYRDTHNALPAILDELEELRRLTTPEVIGEKHRDGNWWMVWDGDEWRKCRWNLRWKAWEHSHGNMALQCFTHALPMPGEPNA